MSTATAAAYNDSMDAGEQLDAEEVFSAAIFGAQDELEEGERFTFEACDRLAGDLMDAALAHFPTGYQVQEDDYKRVRKEAARTILGRQGRPVGGRVFGEEACNQLGRDLLFSFLSFFRPDLCD